MQSVCCFYVVYAIEPEVFYTGALSAFEAAGTSAKIRQGKSAAVNTPNEFNVQSDIMQNDAQSETNRYVQEALKDELAKVNPTADIKAQNKLTHDDINKQSDEQVYALDEAMTKRYGEYLKKQGYSEEGIANLLEQSAKNRTSKQSAIEHIMQIQTDMGDLGVDVKTLTAGSIKNPALNNEISQRIFFTDDQIAKMTPLKLKAELLKLAPDYTKSMYGKISNREGVDRYVDGLIEETDLKKMRDNLKEMQGEVYSEEQLQVNSNNDKIIKRNQLFRTDADPIRKTIGKATDSHPQEVEAIKKHLKELGVEIKERAGVMAYAQGLSQGKPGQFIIEPDASISAWRHEYQHVLDDYEAGWSGLRILENRDICWEREKKSYDIELELAKEYNDKNAIKTLQELMEDRRKEIYGEK